MKKNPDNTEGDIEILRLKYRIKLDIKREGG